ncbi:MAG: ABC transporter ATP-binding protein [Candidatus Krumholzibacteria bacterium]|nr:ABC transporter ATP-binding protein [Candidatus Krumholzibacteria bacterium]
MIEVARLTKYYADRPAVLDVSFTVARGEIVGFLGPNGAGKTTTMRMLTCFLPPTAGTARVAGFDTLSDSFEVRRRVGYLPESVPLYRDLTVAAYLDFIATLKGLAGAHRVRRVGTVMEECGVSDVRNRPIGRLSRGYRQRVGIAQALVSDPEVLILDEPTVGLDPRQVVEIRALIRGLAGDRTIVLSTHILSEVSALCRRVLVINRGRLVSDDYTSNLARNLQRGLVLDVVARGPAEGVSGTIRGVGGVREVAAAGSGDDAGRYRVACAAGEDPRAAVAAALVGAGYALEGLTARDVSLEEIFVQLVTEGGGTDDRA